MTMKTQMLAWRVERLENKAKKLELDYAVSSLRCLREEFRRYDPKVDHGSRIMYALKAGIDGVKCAYPSCTEGLIAPNEPDETHYLERQKMAKELIDGFAEIEDRVKQLGLGGQLVDLMCRVDKLEETANRLGMNDAAKPLRSLHWALEDAEDHSNGQYIPNTLKGSIEGVTSSAHCMIFNIEREEAWVKEQNREGTNMIVCDVKYLPNMPNNKVDIHWEDYSDDPEVLKEFMGRKSKFKVYTISKSEFQLKKVAGTAGNIRSELLEPCKPDAAEERIHESEPGAYAMAYACGVTLASPPTEYQQKMRAWEQVVRKAASMVPAGEMKQKIQKAGDEMLIELGRIKTDVVKLIRTSGWGDRFADEIEDPHYGE